MINAERACFSPEDSSLKKRKGIESIRLLVITTISRKGCGGRTTSLEGIFTTMREREKEREKERERERSRGRIHTSMTAKKEGIMLGTAKNKSLHRSSSCLWTTFEWKDPCHEDTDSPLLRSTAKSPSCKILLPRLQLMLLFSNLST